MLQIYIFNLLIFFEKNGAQALFVLQKKNLIGGAIFGGGNAMTFVKTHFDGLTVGGEH